MRSVATTKGIPAPDLTRTPGGLLQRKCACGQHATGGECEECGKKKHELRRKKGIYTEPNGAPAIVHEALRSPGQPLHPATRAFMEPRFGQDFSRVRVHTDENADASARAVDALAYTVGPHLVFARGRYAPASFEGRQLLAHEMAHIVQQSGAGNEPSPPSRPLTVDSTAETEAQADWTANRIMSGEFGGADVLARARQPVLQRKGGEVLGTKFTHPEKSKSAFTKMEAVFDGQEFVVAANATGAGAGASKTELMRRPAQSGRPVSVRPADAKACGGSTSDSYMNNPRYVGIQDFGAIPEGNFEFRATELATFSAWERMKMLPGGKFQDPFGTSLHGGDWGAGRVALKKTSVLPSPFCGRTGSRSGFFLHGGIMPGSSGCIDIDNDGIDELVSLLPGYKDVVKVKVRYAKSLVSKPPDVGAIDRALGRFTYPEVQDKKKEPGLIDRFKSMFDF